MSRSQITLYGDDARQFEQLRQDVGEQRGGNDPSRAELLRLLMHRVDADEL
jgi:hypothetical protein